MEFQDVVRRRRMLGFLNAPLLIIPHSKKDANLDRYALPGKGHTERRWNQRVG
jgi:hypothetical protein